MSLVPSLLQAIVRVDGEALVMHVGDKPYVVSPIGQVDLATRGLTLDAVSGIVNQLFPIEAQRALDEFGAAQFELPPMPEFPGEHFTVVAARGGDDIWAEIRRRRIPDDDRVPMELFGAVAGAAAERPEVLDAATAPQLDAIGDFGDNPDFEVVGEAAGSVEETDSADLLLPGAEQLWPAEDAALDEMGDPGELESTPPPPLVEKPSPNLGSPVSQQPSVVRSPLPAVQPAASSPSLPRSIEPPAMPAAAVPERPAPIPPPPVVSSQSPQKPVPPPVIPAAPPPSAAFVPPPSAAFAPSQPAPFTPSPTAAFELSAPPPSPFALPQSAVVLPLARNPIRSEVPLPLAEQELAGLDRLLRLAAARGASTLYLSSASRPSVRVDGEVQTLDGAPVLGPNDVESLLLTLMPERNAEALRTGGASEWICDLPDVGRVRCMSFRDHRGPGGVFRMMPVRAVTAEQLGLSREIQAFAIEPEGLVLVAGPRSSGKRTLLSALVDLVNRVRHDHVITIEKEINVVHERNGSFISQREVHGGSDELLAVVRAALRENPDVLVLEELRSAAVMDVALDAASSGQLVIGGLPAPNATGAIDRIIDLYAPECRRQVQLSLAQNLRGVVSQVLLRKTGGGRLAAREVLINTPAVRSILAEGKTSQLPLAIEGGRAHGMVPLNDWLVGYVQSGAVDVREAYRGAVDRAGFLALLKRQGLDTSAIERFA